METDETHKISDSIEPEETKEASDSFDLDEINEALDSVDLDSEVFVERDTTCLSHRRRSWLKLSAVSFRNRVNSFEHPYTVRNG